MPIYEYRCERGHSFEVMQSISEDPLTTCSTCEAPLQRVFHPVAVHFKGSGFYATDYGRKQTGDASDSTANSDSGKDSSKDSGSSESKGGASDSGSSASKGSA